ncbi:MAG: signal peptidase I [bacterium]|nr:signal peptidase I [bacterium]
MVDSDQRPKSGRQGVELVNSDSPVGSADLQTAPQKEAKNEIVEFVKMVLTFLVLFMFLRGCVIECFEVQGESMEPTLMNRERILVFKLPHLMSQHWPFAQWMEGIEERDIVVFDSPDERSKRYVKRIIAEGPPRTGGKAVAAGRIGDEDEGGVPVAVENGVLYVNRQRVEENYLPEGAEPMRGSSGEIWVGEGEYFVMGDNRGVSKDSRVFGAVQDDKIIGTAVFRFWPLNRFSLLR